MGSPNSIIPRVLSDAVAKKYGGGGPSGLGEGAGAVLIREAG